MFTVPSGAIKCAGAPQKIAYFAADYWRKQGVLKDIDVHLVMPGTRPFGIPAIADSLDTVIADYPNVFSLGDAGSTPNSKTGAAIRKQAPVVVANIDAFLTNQPLHASYDGVLIVPDRHLLARHAARRIRLRPQPEPSSPLLNPTTPHRAYWYLKKYGLPFMYWNLMLKGLV